MSLLPDFRLLERAPREPGPQLGQGLLAGELLPPRQKIAHTLLADLEIRSHLRPSPVLSHA